jgi:hypothetical protein
MEEDDPEGAEFPAASTEPLHGSSFTQGGNKVDGENRASTIADSLLTLFSPVPQSDFFGSRFHGGSCF